MTHLARYHNPDRTEHGAPVRTALLDPNNVKVLCKFRVCWKEKVVQVVWKALRVKETFSGRQYLKWWTAGSHSQNYLLSLHVPSGDVDTHFPVGEVAVQLLGTQQSTTSQQTPLKETPRKTQTRCLSRGIQSLVRKTEFIQKEM